jgi:hypothetical protein
MAALADLRASITRDFPKASQFPGASSREISSDGSRDWLVRPSGTGRCVSPIFADFYAKGDVRELNAPLSLSASGCSSLR